MAASAHDTPDKPSTRNVQAIAALEQDALHGRSRLDRISDGITSAAATPWFVIVHAVWFASWIALNTLRHPPFDPYPFSLLTLCVSLEAIFLTGSVLMSQNRITRQADKRAHLDLQVNLLAEQELTAMLGMLRALCERAGVSVVDKDVAVDEMLKDTDIHEIATTIDRELAEGRANTEPAETTEPAKPKPLAAP